MLICSLSSLKDLNVCLQFTTIELLELRLDLFSDKERFYLESSSLSFHLPFIITLKKNDPDLKQSLQIISNLQPAFIDIDESLYPFYIQKVKKSSPHSKIIISKHTSEFYEIKKFFRKYKPCHLKKLVIETESTRQGLAIARLAQKKGLILFAAGMNNSFSRFFSKWHYCYLSYPTGKGQFSIKDLHNFYHKYSGIKSFYALIGSPLSQSLSHITHNKILKIWQPESIYLKIPLSKFTKFDAHNLKSLGCRGLSITTPLKGSVSKALEIPKGYYNTFDFSTNSYTNTDLLALQDMLRVYDKNSRILLLGYGACGKTFLPFLKSRFFYVDVWKRKEQINLKEFYDVVINATSVSRPISDLPTTKCFVNLNRNSMQILENQALKEDANVISGHTFFYLQAMYQFQLWIKNFIFLSQQEFFYLVKEPDGEVQLDKFIYQTLS